MKYHLYVPCYRICGEINGVKGPVQDITTNPEYMDVDLPAGKSFTHVVKDGYTVFAYVIDGEAYFDHIRTPFAHDATGDNYFDMNTHEQLRQAFQELQDGTFIACPD